MVLIKLASFNGSHQIQYFPMKHVLCMQVVCKIMCFGHRWSVLFIPLIIYMASCTKPNFSINDSMDICYVVTNSRYVVKHCGIYDYEVI